MIYSEIFIELGWSFQSHLKSVSYRFFKMLLVRLSVSSCELQNSAIKKASLRKYLLRVNMFSSIYCFYSELKWNILSQDILHKKATVFDVHLPVPTAKTLLFSRQSTLYKDYFHTQKAFSSIKVNLHILLSIYSSFITKSALQCSSWLSYRLFRS